MKKAKLVIIAAVCTLMASCGLFGRKDRCPQVGQANHGISIKK